MGSWYDPALGTFKAIGKLPSANSQACCGLQGSWEAGLFLKLVLKVNVADPPHTLLSVARELVRVSPFVPSSHCLRGPLPQYCTPSRLSSWDQWLTPTEGFEEA